MGARPGRGNGELQEAILSRQRGRESSARTYARSFPIVPVRASGMILETASGERYLDCLSGAGTLAIGHNHPIATEAIRRLLKTEAPLHTLDIATPERDEFTTAILDTVPDASPDRWRIHFCGPTGADAVEAAVKLARLKTGRNALLAFSGAYHGMTAAALSASSKAGLRANFPPALEVIRLPFPYPYRCPFGIGDDGARIGHRYIERMLIDPNSGMSPPSAMLVEPIQGEGGTIPAPDEWLRRMRELTEDHQIPLIVDEVQCGVGRTGTFWASEHSGVIPDVIIASKAIGGGLPLAAIIYRRELDGWAPGAHTGTFRGNQMAMATGSATVRFIRSEKLPERAAQVGDRMMIDLRAIQQVRPSIGEVRGRGLMIGIEIVQPDSEPDCLGSRAPAPDLARAIREECFQRKLIVELGGRYDSVLRLLPPLTISDAQADTVVSLISDAVTAAERTFVTTLSPSSKGSR